MECNAILEIRTPKVFFCVQKCKIEKHLGVQQFMYAELEQNLFLCGYSTGQNCSRSAIASYDIAMQ